MQPIEIEGRLVLECLAEMKLMEIRKAVAQVSKMIDELKTMIEEVENEKNHTDIDSAARAIRFLG